VRAAATDLLATEAGAGGGIAALDPGRHETCWNLVWWYPDPKKTAS